MEIKLLSIVIITSVPVDDNYSCLVRAFSLWMAKVYFYY